jgi:hypothetical protein
MNRVGLAIFAYKRHQTLQNLLENLLLSPRIDEVDLHVFIDGPKSESDSMAVNCVRELVAEISTRIPLKVHTELENLGLKRSIIFGVDTLFKKYEKVIILEDDLEVSKYFIAYTLNQLELFESSKWVGSVTGFSELPSWYKSKSMTYCINRHCSWGWATWKDRWQAIDWSILEKGPELDLSGLWKIGSDLPKLVDQARHQSIDSWSIIFDVNAYKFDWKCVQPRKTLVVNSGFDISATHKQQPRKMRLNSTFGKLISTDQASLATRRKIVNFLIWFSYSTFRGFPLQQISNLLHKRRSLLTTRLNS